MKTSSQYNREQPSAARPTTTMQSEKTENKYSGSEKQKRLFAGAGLIITNCPHRSRRDSDIVVFSQYAFELSALAFTLKAAFSEHIDAFNKRDFYQGLGHTANIALAEGDTIQAAKLKMTVWAKDHFDVTVH